MRADPPVKIHLYMTMIYRHSDNMVGISFSQSIEIAKAIAIGDFSHIPDGIMTWTGPDGFKVEVWESSTGVITACMAYGDMSVCIDDVQFTTAENFPCNRLAIYGPSGSMFIPVDH